MTENYADALNQVIKGTMGDLVGVTITHADLRRVTGQMPMRPNLAQPYGAMHGGAMMTLLDTLAGMGSALNVPSGSGFTTIEFKVNFLRSIRTGTVFAEANAIHIGQRTHVWQVSAHDDHGRQMALATLTQMLIELRSE